jgi:hypothetical protein
MDPAGRAARCAAAPPAEKEAMNVHPRDLAGRASLMAAVVLFGWTALRLWRLAVLLMILRLYWRYRRGLRSPQSDAHGSARWCNGDEAHRAGLFAGRGLFLGRFAGPPGQRLTALVQLFTLPPGQSALAVRQFLRAWTGR